MAWKKLLVCLDGSALTEASLPHAQTLAPDKKAEIIILSGPANSAAEFSFSTPNITDNIIKWYPMIIAAICAVICYLRVPETSHVDIETGAISAVRETAPAPASD